MNRKFQIFPIVLGLLVVGIFSAMIAFFVELSQINNNMSSETVTKEFNVSNYDAVRFDGVSQVEIIQGDQEKMIATGPENVVNETSATVTGKQLIIRQDDYSRIHFFNFGKRYDLVKYTVYVKDLKSIENRGVGSIVMNGIKTKVFSVTNKGVGEIRITGFDGDEVTAILDGVGEIAMKGTTKKMVVDVNGTGSFSGYDLVAEDGKATVRGVGSAEVNCTKTLDGTILGMGSVDYRGNPQVTKTVKGLGSVDAK